MEHIDACDYTSLDQANYMQLTNSVTLRPTEAFFSLVLPTLICALLLY